MNSTKRSFLGGGLLATAVVLVACTPTVPPQAGPTVPGRQAIGEPTATPVAAAPSAPLPTPSDVPAPVTVPPANPSPPTAPPAAPAPIRAGGLVRGSGLRAAQPDAGTEVTAVNAIPAQSFTDSVCVNTHWGYGDTPYGRYDEVSRLLVDSGIHHVRDGGTNPQTLGAITDLADRGVRTTYIMNPSAGAIPNAAYWANPGTGSHLINDLVRQVGVDSLDGVEIGNEWNLTYGTVRRSPDSAGSLSSKPVDGGNGYREFAAALTRDTRAALDAQPATVQLPVVGPSYTTGGDYLEGGVVGGADFGNVHAYQAGRQPETPGWGDNGYGSRGWQLANATAQTPQQPVVVTEGGYSGAVNQNTENIPEDVHARYLPRTFLHYFDGGFDRFCSYEFLDEWNNPERDDNESNFGLLRNDLSPKPAYDAVRNMMSVVFDSDGGGDTNPVSYAVSDPDIEQLLLSKGDGSHVLALWQGASSWNPNTGSRLDVADKDVTVTLPDAADVTAARLDAAGQLTTTAPALTNGRVSLAIGDEVTFVSIR